MKQKNIDFPDCWEEVKPLEWIHLLKSRYKLMIKPGIDLLDVKREWCAYVLRNRGYRFKVKTDDMLLVNGLADTLDWMWKVDEDSGEIILVYDSTVNLIPEWTVLRGPLSHGADLTFGEFRHAVALMNTYNETKEEVHLRALCGTLYRSSGKKVGKADFDGCYREEFHPGRMDLYITRVRMMPEWVMWGIYAWFAYFCQYLIEGIFIIEGKEICFAPVFERKRKDDSGTGSINQDLGMHTILFSVAESGIFGNVADTDNELLLQVMMKLLDDKQRADELLNRNKK